MRKIRNWIKRLSLSQQLSVILIVTISFFALFIFVFLTSSINSFVNDEMLSVIRRNQQAAIVNYRENKTLITGEEDQTIIQIIYEDDYVVKQVGMSLLTDEVQQELHNYVLIYDSMTGKTSDGQLFKIATIDTHSKIVTMVSQPFQQSFRQMLLEVVYLTLLGMIILFFLLILWVGFIIHPLNQIRLYIDKIRKGEDATLAIDRNDEIGELAHAVVEMNEELKNQEKLKEEMVQNISHDLKTPIATIKSYGESIKDGIYPYETLEKSVDIIIENANRLEKKVRGLLMLNRLDYLTYMGEETDRVDMVDIVNKAILSTKQIRSEISISVNDKHAWFKGDEEPWRVVMENLIDNALRYAITKVVVNIEDTSVSVFNDGRPLEQEEIDHMFNPYERGSGGQFGLGLSIVKRVVNAYSYKVSAQNIDDGVMFTIYLIQSEREKRIARRKAKKEESKQKI